MAVHARARSESDIPRRWRLAALCASSAAPPEEEPVAAPAPPEGNWNEALPDIPATRILAEEEWIRELPARPESCRQILLQCIFDAFVAEALQGRVEGGLRLGQPGFRRSGLVR